MEKKRTTIIIAIKLFILGDNLKYKLNTKKRSYLKYKYIYIV